MGMPAHKIGPSQASIIDAAFLQILSDFVEAIVADAGQATSRILDLSSQFLSSNAKSALQNFHDLYFGGDQITTSKEEMNREVDDLFEQAKAQLASKGDVTAGDLKLNEDERAKQFRLTLSGLQKQLETIVSLDAGIREKLVPVLTTMQFEDLIKHRLAHIRDGWKKANDASAAGLKDFQAVADELAGLCSSNEERKLYYNVVLGKEPPQGAAEDVLMFEF